MSQECSPHPLTRADRDSRYKRPPHYSAGPQTVRSSWRRCQSRRYPEWYRPPGTSDSAGPRGRPPAYPAAGPRSGSGSRTRPAFAGYQILPAFAEHQIRPAFAGRPGSGTGAWSGPDQTGPPCVLPMPAPRPGSGRSRSCRCRIPPAERCSGSYSVFPENPPRSFPSHLSSSVVSTARSANCFVCRPAGCNHRRSRPYLFYFFFCVCQCHPALVKTTSHYLTPFNAV